MGSLILCYPFELGIFGTQGHDALEFFETQGLSEASWYLNNGLAHPVRWVHVQAQYKLYCVQVFVLVVVGEFARELVCKGVEWTILPS